MYVNQYPWAKAGVKVRCIKSEHPIYKEGHIYEIESTEWGLAIKDGENFWNGFSAEWAPVLEFSTGMIEDIL